MRTLTRNPHRVARLLIVVAAAVLIAVPQMVEAAPKSSNGKGKTTTTSGFDIAISMSDLADPVRFGDEVTYRTRVSNVGSATANALNVELEAWEGYWYQHAVGTPLAAAVYSSVTPSKGSCAIRSSGPGSELPLPATSGYWLGLDDIEFWFTDFGIYGARVERETAAFCNLGTLAPGETATIDVVVRPTYPSRYKPHQEGEAPTLTNFAWNRLADGNSSNDSDWEQTTVTTGSDAADCILTGMLANLLWRLSPFAPCSAGLG